MKLTLNNPFMQLRAKSMGKLHTISHLFSSDSVYKASFERNDLVTVFKLPKSALGDGVQLMAPHYTAVCKETLKDSSTPDTPFTNLYIATDGMHFQVAFVALSLAAGNAFMKNRNDTGLICSSVATDKAPELHFIASCQPA